MPSARQCRINKKFCCFSMTYGKKPTGASFRSGEAGLHGCDGSNAPSPDTGVSAMASMVAVQEDSYSKTMT
jgi:hypothetical protein